MIEPRAWEIEDANGAAFVRLHRLIDINKVVAVKKTKLVTVADVLAALRERAPKKVEGQMGLASFVINEFLDAFERDQGSAT